MDLRQPDLFAPLSFGMDLPEDRLCLPLDLSIQCHKPCTCHHASICVIRMCRRGNSDPGLNLSDLGTPVVPQAWLPHQELLTGIPRAGQSPVGVS